MNYLKYFKNDKYDFDKNNCWHFVQKVYREEHNIILPDVPICEDSESYVRANVKARRLEKAKTGSFVFVATLHDNHVGYALNDKEYMHKTANQGVRVSLIPKNAEIYEIFKND